MDPAVHAFRLSSRGWLSLARLLPGILALVWSCSGRSVMAGWSLVAAVWADALVCWYARRRFAETSSSVHADGFVDCISFVAAPACFAASMEPAQALAPALIVFVLAGVFRLVRFQMEGLVQGGYRGLPVTYNGYLFPAAGLLQFYLPALNAAILWWALLLLSSALMVSTILIPEI